MAAQNEFLISRDILLRPLQSLAGAYDFVFLDTAPNATTPTIAAYKAARWFVRPTMPDPFAIAGLNDALAEIAGAQQHGNPGLRLLGVVLSGVKRRTKLAGALADYVERLFTLDGGKSAKFATTVSRSTVIPEAQKVGRTLMQTAPEHKVTEQYRQLVREIEERLATGAASVASGGPAPVSSAEETQHG